MFYFDEIYGKKILKSDLIKNAFFTTRESFIKTKEAGLFDITQHNKMEIKNYLKVKAMVSPKQTHTTNIALAEFGVEEYPDTDGLILTNKKMAIYLNFADCTPLVFYDKKRNIGAISHAGWRGTVGKIGPKTVEKMVEEYKCKPKDIAVLIGPCISATYFEVGKDVYQKLYATIGIDSLPQSKNYFADLKNINRRQLENIGVEKIDVCPYCTIANNDTFFSYRKEKATTNRQSAVLKLNGWF